VKLKVAHHWHDLSGLERIAPLALTDQEAAAVEFCMHWKNGKPEFEFETSGTTGSRRRIRFSREQLQSSAELTRDALSLRQNTKALLCLDPRFIAGAMMLVRGLVVGMDIVVQSPSSNPFLTLDERIDFVALVPYQLTRALNESSATLSKVKTVIIGGAPLSEELKIRVKQLPGRYYATYGMTETISHIALQRLNGEDAQSSFELLPGVTASVDQRGCLVIHSAHLGQEPIVTNDVVSMISPTQFKWLGRVDEVINTGGIKVHPPVVEEAAGKVLHSFQINRRYFITGLPDAALGTQVVMAIEGPPLGKIQEHEFLKALSSILKKYELPRQLLYLEHFVETPTQKVDRIKTLGAIISGA
jgi:O-succinylbenzoic acid--CoA ligase